MTCSTRQPGLSGEQEFPFRSDLNRSEKKKYPKQDSYKTDFLHLSSSLRGAHGTSQFECIRQQLQTNSFPRRDFDLQLSTPANPFPPLTETRRDETRRSRQSQPRETSRAKSRGGRDLSRHRSQMGQRGVASQNGSRE